MEDSLYSRMKGRFYKNSPQDVLKIHWQALIEKEVAKQIETVALECRQYLDSQLTIEILEDEIKQN